MTSLLRPSCCRLSKFKPAFFFFFHRHKSLSTHCESISKFWVAAYTWKSTLTKHRVLSPFATFRPFSKSVSQWSATYTVWEEWSPSPFSVALQFCLSKTELILWWPYHPPGMWPLPGAVMSVGVLWRAPLPKGRMLSRLHSLPMAHLLHLGGSAGSGG